MWVGRRGHFQMLHLLSFKYIQRQNVITCYIYYIIYMKNNWENDAANFASQPGVDESAWLIYHITLYLYCRHMVEFFFFNESTCWRVSCRIHYFIENILRHCNAAVALAGLGVAKLFTAFRLLSENRVETEASLGRSPARWKQFTAERSTSAFSHLVMLYPRSRTSAEKTAVQFLPGLSAQTMLCNIFINLLSSAAAAAWQSANSIMCICFHPASRGRE